MPTVAIIGSRLCSQYGRLSAQQFGQGLALAGVQIVSGMARGIDGIAQNAAAAAGGASFGVLGCGVNVVYPAQNREIYKNVLERGGLISEFPPDTPPRPPYFAERNRIISGLCDLLLVIEAGARSGTKITVRNALEQGRDIYALPGRINDPCSEGCNELISQGAGIALGVTAILEALGIYAKAGSKTDPPGDKPALTGPALSGPPLSGPEKKVYEALDFYPCACDSLAQKSGLDIRALTDVLFTLTLKGLAKEVCKNHYIRVR